MVTPEMLAPLENPRGLVLLDGSVLASPFTDLRVVLETTRAMRDLSGLDVGVLAHHVEPIPLGTDLSPEALLTLGWRGVARLLPRRVKWNARRPRIDVLRAIAKREQAPLVAITHTAVGPTLVRGVRWLRAPLGVDARTLLHAAGGMLDEMLEVRA